MPVARRSPALSLFTRRLFAGASVALALAAAVATTIPAQAHDGPSGAVTEKIGVTGEVEHPLTLSVGDLQAFPAAQVVEVAVTRQPAGVGAKPDLYKGVLLRDILAKAVLLTHDHNDVKKMAIIASASDGYAVVFSWSEIFNSPTSDGIIVYFEKNGQPLPDNEGRIALISSKDVRTGPRHVKWLQSLDVKKIVQ